MDEHIDARPDGRLGVYSGGNLLPCRIISRLRYWRGKRISSCHLGVPIFVWSGFYIGTVGGKSEFRREGICKETLCLLNRRRSSVVLRLYDSRVISGSPWLVGLNRDTET